MALIEEYTTHTGCRVRVFDDFIVQTMEEKERIDTNLHLYYWNDQLKKQHEKNKRGR